MDTTQKVLLENDIRLLRKEKTTAQNELNQVNTLYKEEYKAFTTTKNAHKIELLGLQNQLERLRKSIEEAEKTLNTCIKLTHLAEKRAEEANKNAAQMENYKKLVEQDLDNKGLILQKKTLTVEALIRQYSKLIEEMEKRKVNIAT